MGERVRRKYMEASSPPVPATTPPPPPQPPPRHGVPTHEAELLRPQQTQVLKCGNVARSRCPYQSCKSCCAKAQNQCHILIYMYRVCSHICLASLPSMVQPVDAPNDLEILDSHLEEELLYGP